MRAIQINSRSWHYRFLSKMTSNVSEDICGYTRQLVGFSILTAVVGVVALILTAVATDALTWMVFCLVNLTWIEPSRAAVVFMMTLAAISIFVLVGFVQWLIDRRREHKKPPTFIGTAWQHFHDKTCARIEVIEP